MRRAIKAMARWIHGIARAATHTEYATFRAHCYKCATTYHVRIEQACGLQDKIEREKCRCYSPDWFDSACINGKSGTHDWTGSVARPGWNAGAVKEDYQRTQEFAALICRMEAGKHQINIADMSEILGNIQKVMPSFYGFIAAEKNETYWKRAKESGKIAYDTIEPQPKKK